jgi:hypothetical protein
MRNSYIILYLLIECNMSKYLSTFILAFNENTIDFLLQQLYGNMKYILNCKLMKPS